MQSAKSEGRVIRQKTCCRMCTELGEDTASEHEWPCLIFEGWICETHCTEIEMHEAADTQNKAKRLVNLSAGEDVLETCRVCRYSSSSKRCAADGASQMGE